MKKAHLKKTQRILVRFVVLCVLGFFALATLWGASISVGYLNLALSYEALKPQAELAMHYPLTPGQRARVTLEGEALVASPLGRITILQASEAERVVIFDRGGGHLGIQGYLYAPTTEDVETVYAMAFGDLEAREVNALIGGWYSYDSTED